MWLFVVLAAIWMGVILSLLGMIVYAVSTGRLPNKFNTVLRDESPKTFWLLVSGWIALIAGMSYFVFYVASAPGIGLIR